MSDLPVVRPRQLIRALELAFLCITSAAATTICGISTGPAS
jgi:hypothetical protein